MPVKAPGRRRGPRWARRSAACRPSFPCRPSPSGVQMVGGPTPIRRVGVGSTLTSKVFSHSFTSSTSCTMRAARSVLGKGIGLPFSSFITTGGRETGSRRKSPRRFVSARQARKAIARAPARWWHMRPRRLDKGLDEPLRRQFLDGADHAPHRDRGAIVPAGGPPVVRAAVRDPAPFAIVLDCGGGNNGGLDGAVIAGSAWREAEGLDGRLGGGVAEAERGVVARTDCMEMTR